MSEMDGMEQAQNLSETVSSTSTPAQRTDAERTFTQAEVNDFIKHAKYETAERIKNGTAKAAQNQQYSQNYENSGYNDNQQNYRPNQQQPYSGITREEAERIATERFQKDWTAREQEARQRAEQREAERIANEFYTKVGAGDGGIDAFHKLANDTGLDLQSIPYHVQLANMVDNTRDVMIELMNNPTKVGQIQSLIDIDLRAGRQPRLALAEIQKLSKSIKENESAKNFKQANPPLGQLRPSNAGTGVNGALSVADYKRKYKV